MLRKKKKLYVAVESQMKNFFFTFLIKEMKSFQYSDKNKRNFYFNRNVLDAPHKINKFLSGILTEVLISVIKRKRKRKKKNREVLSALP